MYVRNEESDHVGVDREVEGVCVLAVEGDGFEVLAVCSVSIGVDSVGWGCWGCV